MRTLVYARDVDYGGHQILHAPRNVKIDVEVVSDPVAGVLSLA